MLRIHFTAADLARTTIAREPDPLWEVLLSLHMLQESNAELIYGKWRTYARRAVPGRLLELTPVTGYSPDFLTPVTRHKAFEDALETVVSTPGTVVLEQVDHLMTRRPATSWTRTLAGGSAPAMAQLAAGITAYYERAIAPYWNSIRRQVVANRSDHADTLLDHGIDHLLSTLHPRVRWEPPVLQVLDFVDTDLQLDGRGLRLQPSFFCWQAPTKLRDGDLPPVLVFPTRPVPGDLYRGDKHERSDSLAALLGRTRAHALEVIAGDRTTSEIAKLCRVSVPAASQQAAVLRDAGLITSRRAGLAVQHQLTALGRELLDGRV
ncbi:MAG TPA: winged helix-turn-helix domain-containing protein [Kribbella sp.]|nr:winged helix-turn-helix domain-containing protein [Kribbella sp.]